MFNHDRTFAMNDLYNSHPKNFLSLVEPYCAEITKHPKVHLEYKDKRTAIIEAACVHYGKAYDVIAVLNPLHCSYLLGHSLLVIKSFTEECAKFHAAVDYFESETTAIMKQCQEVNDWYKNVFATLDKKSLVSSFLDDVNFWSKTYEFEYDKTTLLAEYNTHKKDHTDFLKKSYKKNHNSSM